MLRLVREQAGVISREQLLSVGLSSQQIHRKVADGVLVRLLPRTFRHASCPDSWLQRLWAAHLWARGQAIISHEAAGAFWKLDGCPSGPVSVIWTRGLQSPAEHIRIHRVAQIPPHHVTRTRGLAVTTPTRTIMDLAAVLTEENLEAALDCALRRGSTSLRRLGMELARCSGRGQRGRKALKAMLHERSPDYAPTHSMLESRFRRLLKRHRLPLPAQQYIVRRLHGGFARVDFFYPEQGLVIEVDGYSSHGNRQAWQHDLQRQNDLVIAGLKVLRYSWWDVCNEELDIAHSLKSFFSPSLPLGGTGPEKNG